MTRAITSADITRARDRLAGRVRVTPVLEVDPDVWSTRGSVVAKLELLQHTGSFKARGALNLLLTTEPDRPVVAASGGNFGLALAWAAGVTGHRAVIFVPETSSASKRDALAAYGCELHVVPGFYADAFEAATAWCQAEGGLQAHAYDQPEVVAGAGTCAVELIEQAPDVDTVLVAVGGGGLIGGVSTWLGARGVRVVGVETTTTATMHDALRAGRPVDVEVSGLAADSLGARRVGELGMAAARRHVDEVVLVEDDDVRRTQSRTWERLRLIAEPGGAVAAAALVAGAYRPAANERVGVVLCGANTDPATVSRGGGAGR